MSTRFSWMLLLVIIGLIGSGTSNEVSCNGNDEIFLSNPESLTISPSNFTNDLKATISKTIESSDPNIEIFWTFGRDEDNGKDDECKNGPLSGEFTISDPANKVTCELKYTLDSSGVFTFTRVGQENVNFPIPLQSSAAGPYPVKVSVKKEDDKFNMIVSHPEETTIASVFIKECWQINGLKQEFQLTFKKPALQDCGIALDMKGDYQIKEAMVEGLPCNIGTVSPDTTEAPNSGTTSTTSPGTGPTTSSGTTSTTSPGTGPTTSSGTTSTANPGPETTPVSETTTAPNSDDGGSKLWWIILIIVIVVVVLVIIGVLVYVFYIRKSQDADEDVEEGKSQKEEGDESTDAANGPSGDAGQGGHEAEQTKPESENTQNSSDKTQD